METILPEQLNRVRHSESLRGNCRHRRGLVISSIPCLLQCEYDDPLSTPRQKKPVSRTVGPRPGPWTYCPPLKKWVRNSSGSFMTWTYSPFTGTFTSCPEFCLRPL
ncbi:hypothetical protein J6590_020192 [Homalodisca vitripennis]|nr:hypothetical protein J6590_020192 [Homalodisca vitripennis]